MKRTAATASKNVNLGLAAVFAFYIFVTTLQLSSNSKVLNGDFLAFWSTGKIANQDGYSHLYDLPLLAKYQGIEDITRAAPAPYPAVFLIPFQLFALFSPETGAWIWRWVNLAGLAAYLSFFLRKLSPGRENIPIWLALALTLPVLNNFIWSQTNLFLMIGIGEFLRLSKNEKPIWAGAALGLLLIKPQLLMLLGPMLILTANWLALAGLIISTAIIGLSSALLTGPDGIIGFYKIIAEFSAGLAAGNPAAMTNLRMLAIQVNQIAHPTGWIVLLAAAGLTLYGVVTLWRKRIQPKDDSYAYIVLGTISATLLVSWHSHLHYLIMLLPPLAALAKTKLLPLDIIHQWVFAGALTYIIVLTGVIVFTPPANYAEFLFGMWGLISSAVFLFIALKKVPSESAQSIL